MLFFDIPCVFLKRKGCECKVRASVVMSGVVLLWGKEKSYLVISTLKIPGGEPYHALFGWMQAVHPKNGETMKIFRPKFATF